MIGAFEHILRRENAKYVIVDGNGFHRYDRDAFADVIKTASAEHRPMSHFAPEANLFERLEALLKDYAADGTGTHRRYIHDAEEAEQYHQKAGAFTPWEPIPEDTDLLYYQGLHGCFASQSVDIAQYMDLKIGVVPIVNLEWIQKVHRDTAERGYSTEAVTDTILRRMRDYVRYITPQFSRTHINFQRVPTVDTSNPFVARDVPTMDESLVVVRFADLTRYPVDFPNLLNKIHNSFMSRRKSLVIPGGELGPAMELILAPLVHDLLEKRRRAH